MNRPVLAVSEINSYIKTLMDHDMILSNVFVKGEISNFKLHYSGHMYLTLKDKDGVIRAVMFKSAGFRLKFKPENGMKVIVQGRVTVYERDGQYQLYIENMQPDGIGALHIAFEQLKNKLKEEGLFDEERKKRLPQYPKRIGVVTSPTGAAVRDILNILKRRYPSAEVLIYPVLVQGEQACEQIAQAVGYFNEKRSADVIIVGRGGGSIEELWPFNEEVVARSIAQSAIPVVSAVGHETDFTISDFVADLRAPTPSAAAEIVVPAQFELRDKIVHLKSRLVYSFNKKIENNRLILKGLLQSPAFKNPMDKINENRLLIDEMGKNLTKNIVLRIDNNKKQLGLLSEKLNTLSPLAVLARGYAIAKKEDGNVIRSVQNVQEDDKINVRVNDGYMQCTVDKVYRRM
ncbi:exodeoxyribonuclease VII large subunit [Petroclostridium sp. X23]|uniref:exodeoxyribonuclease VII large subunit n=1 Tax=Petroclostridium sp. X23 TaxID=3045146 RepID=UPI0024AE5BFA|nr:exodeoxyribonuclease VII large subunit [Petroclostridium sp. X23]WHH61597.1 exodeoxyribonuclease VII large subunit [Petroclostridium sp. X23]